MNKPHIVILGAGYAGLVTARQLQKRIGANEASITLVNKNTYHYETTWLHEASAGTLSFDRACYPIEPLLNPQKVRFVHDTVIDIRHTEKQVVLQKETLSYDYLVVGLGFESETFGIKGLKEHAFSIANLNATRKLHHRLVEQFAHYHEEENGAKKDINIIVGGGGFTGIEFLGELANKVPALCKAYDVDPARVHIICVEAGPNLLAGFDPSLVAYAKQLLEKKGVTFKIGYAIKECSPTGIVIANKEESTFIESQIVIWAAGVRGSSLIESSGFESNRGKVQVDPFLRYPSDDSVFIIGDCALIINEKENRPYPPTAQISMQQGQNVAKNLASLVKGKSELTPFVYKPKGTVCSLGKKKGVGVAFGFKFKGRLGGFVKTVVDNRALLLIGGLPLVWKKGK